jgi:iduronate 2-sulfatase
VKGKKKKKDKPADPTPATSTDERGARFDMLDKDKAGKLTREYYTTHQSDAAAAAERFNKYDTDKDGLLSREEFIGRGKQPEN